MAIFVIAYVAIFVIEYVAIFVIEYVVFFEWLRESVQVSYCLFTFDSVVIGDYHEYCCHWRLS
jgi:hypothetical protein